MQSPPASGLQSLCLCNQGYHFTGSYATCAACGAGTYKDTVSNGPDDCQACQSHSLSPSNSTARGDCACNAGFSPDGEECAPCGPGLFKAQPGGDDCDPCAEGTYNPNLNATKCLDCYADSASLAGSDALTDCECDPGHVLIADGCARCAAGKFDNGETEQCSECAGGTYTDQPGRTVCAECGSDSASHDTPHVACQCNAGFALDAAGCAECAADTYKDVHGDQGCTPCQTNSQSPAGATEQQHCQCKRGYRQEGGSVCAACGVGEFSDALDAAECSACEPGTFNDEEAQTECGPCWADSQSNAELSGCDCLEGFAPPLPGSDPPRCQECEANSFKSVVGNEQCGPCPTDSVSEPGSSALAQCLCNPGFFLDDGACRACERGSHKGWTGNDACTPCAPTYTTEFLQNTGPEACVCRPAHEPTGGECAACRADTYKAEFSNGACSPCRGNSSSLAESLADEQYDCLCEPGFDDHPRVAAPAPRECEPCVPGTHKDSLSNGECVACGTDVFTSAPGGLTCQPCGASSSTHGQSGQARCDCVVGFARVHGAESACEQCGAGTFKDDFRLQSCSECTPCDVDERVVHECTSTRQTVCEACPAHSSSLGRRRAHTGPCDCDEGYELDDDQCRACVPGTFKDHQNNSYACQFCPDGTFAAGFASVQCAACREHCADEGTAESFVAAECSVTADVECTACSVCAPGSFAQPSCGLASANDRRDTVCAECTPGYFCEGGAHRERCTNNALSLAGSSVRSSCGCQPGYEGDAQGCVRCGFDVYCSEGVSHDCPAHSVTFGVENAVQHDCHCLHGFYRVAELAADPANFACALCTVDVYCVNNLRFNCSDERMRAPAGSDAPSDCRCVDGFHNDANHTACLECERDHFCVNGSQFACDADQWTQGLTRQDVCTCRPGLRAGAAGCVACGLGSFCIGDDHAQTCRAHSETADDTASTPAECLCSAGFAEVPGAPPACESCVQGDTFKSTRGNHACSSCTRCSVAAGIWTSVWCDVASDAHCDACDSCSDGEEYTGQACTEFSNARCDTCAQCDYAHEFEFRACQPTHDRVCRLYSTDLSSCAPGFYRGGHTATSDSACLPCLYNDTLFNRQSLHQARTPGAEYNDAYSCGVSCLGHSRWRDAQRQFLGCVSCEVGNVLLKVFEDTAALSCQFSCHAGYERVPLPDGSEDCFVAPLASSPRSEFTHDLFVGDYTWLQGVSRVRVSHSAHGYFAVVVGRAPPAGCKRGAAGCCFAAHWRVSTLEQMGLLASHVAAAPETCVGLPGLAAAARGSTALEFELPDEVLASVGTCRTEAETQVCALAISLVDVITWHAVTKHLELRTTRAVATAHTTRTKQMLPLSLFDVRVGLWRVLASGEHVFQIVTVARGAPMRMQSSALGMTQLAHVEDCERFSLSNATRAVPGSLSLVSPAANTSTVSYWLSGANVSTVKIVFHLAMLDEPLNIMDVAAVRDVRHLVPVCAPGTHRLRYDAGRVWAAAGLGRDAVYRMRHARDAGQGVGAGGRVHGKLGTLLTFVAESTFQGNASISLGRILASHLRAREDAYRLANATDLVRGVRDFSPAFRTWCFSLPSLCHLEYINVHVARSNLFVLEQCSVSGQTQARTWLRANYGLVHDDGHVQALCALQGAMRPHASLAVLVNTMKYTSRQHNQWQMLQNLSHDAISSHVWADFRINQA